MSYYDRKIAIKQAEKGSGNASTFRILVNIVSHFFAILCLVSGSAMLKDASTQKTTHLALVRKVFNDNLVKFKLSKPNFTTLSGG